MPRTRIAATVVSAPGPPGSDGHRPKFLDEPVSSFNPAVNLTVLDGKRVLWAIDIARAMHRVAPSWPGQSRRRQSSK